MDDASCMERALFQARTALLKEEVPIGAIIVLEDKIIAEAHNNSLKKLDATGHAEIEALRLASQAIGNYRLLDAIMYVTLDPCMMCCGSLANSRIKEFVFAAKDPKSGAVVSNDNLLDSTYLNHRVKYREGPFSEDSSTLLKDFFAGKRN